MIRIRPLSHRIPALPAAALVLTLVGAVPAPTEAATAAPDDTSLATFEGGRVTPTDFTLAWQALVPSERPPGPDRVTQKRAFLQRVVDRMLIAREAAKTPLVLTADEEAEVERTRRQILQNELFAELTKDLPAPTAEELDRFRRQKTEIAEARFISFPTPESARSWRSRLLRGSPMSQLEAAIQAGGPSAPNAEEFRWLAAEQIPDTLATIIWSLRPGQVSEIQMFGGQAVLLHLRTYQRRPDATATGGELGLAEDYRRRQQDRVRQRIRMELVEKSGREFVDAGMNRLLEGFLKLAPRRDVDSLTGQPIMRPNLPLPVFTAADTGLVVAKTEARVLTLVEYLRYWSRVPPFARPEVRERLVLESTVDRVLLEDQLLAMAHERGLDRNPAVEREIRHMLEGFALERWYAANYQSRVQPDEAALRAYFESKPTHYDDPPELEARMIVLERRSLADSLLAQLRAGKTFEELAPLHSIDGETGSKGGKTGIIRKGTNKNTGLEDAMFASAIGALAGPEQTPEGWVIWRVEKRTPGKVRTFEEAREWVDRDYRIVEADRMLAADLVEMRKRYGVKVYEDRVTDALGAGGAWGD